MSDPSAEVLRLRKALARALMLLSEDRLKEAKLAISVALSGTE